jgi:small subunit ribosomal protein S20
MGVDGGGRFVYPRRSSSRDKKRTESMANSPSAKKRARQADRRTAINKSRRSRVRTFIRKVEEAITSGDQGAALEALRAAQPEIIRGARKGILHRNTASRKVSRLHHRVNAMTA